MNSPLPELLPGVRPLGIGYVKPGSKPKRFGRNVLKRIWRTVSDKGDLKKKGKR